MMAAISAARCGSDVILLDRNPWGVDHSANTFFEGMASQTGFQVDDCYIKRSLQGMRIITPSGHCATVPVKGYFIDRRRFDDHYLKIAEKEGVMLLEGQATGILIRSGNCLGIYTARGYPSQGNDRCLWSAGLSGSSSGHFSNSPSSGHCLGRGSHSPASRPRRRRLLRVLDWQHGPRVEGDFLARRRRPGYLGCLC